MFKYILQSVDGIQWFGIAALLLFFSAFCFAFFRAYFLSDKSEMDHMASLPLED
jgi:cbb3-type cytochrome oxidase subunit 3